MTQKVNVITQKVKEAKEYATKKHEGQVRKYSGLPYITHPIAVAEMVQNYTDDEDVISAAYLHDVVEDCNVIPDELSIEFGFRVSKFVEEVTNPSRNYPRVCRRDRKKMDRLHIAKGGTEAHLIKVCDRICNINDLLSESEKTDWPYIGLYTTESYRLLEFLDKAPSELLTKLIQLCNTVNFS